MPDLKTRTLFISHAWSYDDHYWKLVEWFNNAPNFHWKNCSVPNHDSLPDKTSRGLSEGMTRQLAIAQGVIILGGMYAAYSGWIDYEIREAKRMNKVIIGVRPWNATRVPLNVQDAATVMVNWNGASIIQAIRDFV